MHHRLIAHQLGSATRIEFSVSLMIFSRRVKLEQVPNRNCAIRIFLCRFLLSRWNWTLTHWSLTFNDLIILNRKSTAQCSKISHFQITGQYFMTLLLPLPRTFMTGSFWPIFQKLKSLDQKTLYETRSKHSDKDLIIRWLSLNSYQIGTFIEYNSTNLVRIFQLFIVKILTCWWRKVSLTFVGVWVFS